MASSFEIELSGTLSATPALVWSLLEDHELVAAWLGAGVNGARVRTAAAKAPGELELLIEDPSSLLRRIDVTVALEPARLEIETRFRLRAVCHPRRFSGLLTPLLRVRAQVLLHQAVRELRTAVAGRFGSSRRAMPPLPEQMGWRAPAAGGSRLSL
jgi:hypothetical protein